jgi:hypothetical protein
MAITVQYTILIKSKMNHNKKKAQLRIAQKFTQKGENKIVIIILSTIKIVVDFVLVLLLGFT